MTATLKTLVEFASDSSGGGPNDTMPEGHLITDSDGDPFGATDEGGGDGTVFEMVKAALGYASTPTSLVSFEANGRKAEHART
jgi:hypothetical protein